MKTSSWALIELEEKYLFIQRSEETSRAGQWCPPGGGRKPNESQEEACIRETFEEVGIEVTIDRLLSKEETFYYFLCKPVHKTPKVVLKPDECSAYEWVRLNELLELGVVMELKRMTRVLSKLGVYLDIPYI
jgi:8-oxo-dGTP pyrophosphatase MutT (NUDIX family)